jgi:hypothetical protein
MVKMYYVVMCDKCRAVRFVRIGVKTYYCFNCRRKRPMKKAIILWECKDSKECIYLVQKLKSEGIKFLDRIEGDTP